MVTCQISGRDEFRRGRERCTLGKALEKSRDMQVGYAKALLLKGTGGTVVGRQPGIHGLAIGT